jgi:hypothetical protein
VVRDSIERRDGVRRWDELGEFVTFHAHVATKLWLPTKYFLVNRDTENYKFAVCWGGREDTASDLHQLRKALPSQALAERACPLAARLRSLADGIRREAPGLEANGKHVTVVVCTQGLPTNKEGRYSREVQREFQRELQALGELPVKIIIRVCSDDENVMDMFNSMDCRMGSLDVLDDFWGEVRAKKYTAYEHIHRAGNELLGAQIRVVRRGERARSLAATFLSNPGRVSNTCVRGQIFIHSGEPKTCSLGFHTPDLLGPSSKRLYLRMFGMKCLFPLFLQSKQSRYFDISEFQL